MGGFLLVIKLTRDCPNILYIAGNREQGTGNREQGIGRKTTVEVFFRRDAIVTVF
ncbi:hypothetical protein PLAN_70148 [Planktothrix rubescens CCAP 1459/22]|uniref:Uncharacterized protein n=1 Tax=Planktothrix rubescens CCAP 1459/22 TaxID=329571 RepID=A0A6J7ZSF9_PLARU|nr:hypothetical protein PLAN_70148 [Planktothrix rubescens NIVA-CYA 18]